jgi:hypothetical protein
MVIYIHYKELGQVFMLYQEDIRSKMKSLAEEFDTLTKHSIEPNKCQVRLVNNLAKLSNLQLMPRLRVPMLIMSYLPSFFIAICLCMYA